MTITRDNARQEIRERWREIMPALTGEARQRVNGETSYICPLCGHGTNGDGLTRNPRSKDGNGLKCFACEFSGDILDLIQATEKTDYNGALNYAADILRMDIEPTRASAADDFKREETRSKPQGDLSAYFAACRQRLTDPAAVSYLKARGISLETAEKYGLGFDPAADPAQSNHPCPRLIIPTSATHYVGRRTDGGEEYKKMNNKGGRPGIFNEAALYDAETVFVTEGAFDALSILEAGAAAVAINSTSNAELLVKQLASKRTDATLILCLDNDETGKKATQAIKDGLQRLNISYVTADISGSHKDPNEALTADPAAFAAAIKTAQAQTAARPDNVKDYIDGLMQGDLERFKEAKDRKTGFDNLDKKAGGLYSGLYVIAAVSSLGKTTFCHQMADQLAAAGNDVLFFSLEQSRLELVSKSIARITAQHDIRKAVTSLDIRRGYLPGNVLDAADEYKNKVQDRLSIVEGNFACTVSFIGDYTRQYVRRTGTRPILFVDYLQILQGDQDRRQSTKETVDATVTELKRISRELDLTVFVVSSVNRANYLAPIDFESLKESGGIEYTADVIWGLQLQCLNEQIFDQEKKIKEKRQRIREAKAADPRKIELLCLKNRYGISSFSCNFDYYPRFDLFTPGSGDNDAEEDFDPRPAKKKR